MQVPGGSFDQDLSRPLTYSDFNQRNPTLDIFRVRVCDFSNAPLKCGSVRLLWLMGRLAAESTVLVSPAPAELFDHPVKGGQKRFEHVRVAEHAQIAVRVHADFILT